MATEEMQDLTDRVFLLRDNLEKGRIKIAKHLGHDFIVSLEKIRLDINGFVVPESVDGRIRALTNGLKYFRYREEAKKSISLSKIQESYFRILENNFGQIHKDTIKAGVDANVAAHSMARDQKFVAHFTQNIELLISDLQEFWKLVGDAAFFHVEDLQCLKAVFGGDLFPYFKRNIASSAALYVDTIILPCPITHSANLIRMWKPEKAVYYCVKHAINALGYRDLALTDVNPPIIVVLPDIELLEAHHVETIKASSEEAAVRHGSAIFGNSFSSIQELTEFLDKLATPEDLLKKVKRPNRLLFSSDWGGDPGDQLKKALNQTAGDFDGILGEKNAGRTVFMNCVGRMSQAAAVTLRSIRLRGTPLIDAETSWQYLNWKMEYDAQPSAEPEHMTEAMHILRALQAEEERNLCWLGNVPVDAIINLRSRGLMDEVRAILSKGVPKLIETTPNNFFRTGDQVVANLDSAFREHQRTLVDARNKRLKLYGLDVGACLAVGGISVAAAITGNPMLGAAAGVLGVAGLPNLRDIKTGFKDLKEQEHKISTSPTGIMFEHVT